jgi:hypothetical protein
MPKVRWFSLDDTTKAIWDSIEDKFKKIILVYTTSSPHTSSFAPRRANTPNTSFNKPSSKSKKAVLHEFLKAFDDELEEASEEAMTFHYQLTLNQTPLQIS